MVFVGTDGLRPRAIEALVSEEISRKGWKLLESYFSVVGDFEFSAVIRRIKRTNQSSSSMRSSATPVSHS